MTQETNATHAEADAATAEERQRRAAFIGSLRDLAAFLERHPAVPAPYNAVLNVFVSTREEIVQVARVATWEKCYMGEWFMLRKAFGQHLALEVNASRETVCRKVVKGTRVVPARAEEVVEDVEWICEEALLAGTKTEPSEALVPEVSL